MSIKLVVFLSSLGDLETSNLSWSIISDGVREDGQSPIEPASRSGNFYKFQEFYVENFEKRKSSKIRAANKPQVFAILPANFLTYTKVNIPTSNKQQIIKALPFAVEEFVIGDIDNLQIGISKIYPDGFIRASIVDKNIINNWLSLFSAINIKLDCICGFPDIIKTNDNQAKILLYEDVAFFKSYNYCFQLDAEVFLSMLKSFSDDAIEVVDVFYKKADKNLLSFSKEIKSRYETSGLSNIEIHEYFGDVFDFVCENTEIVFDDKNSLIPDLSGQGIEKYINPAYWVPFSLAASVLIIAQISLNAASGFYFNWRSELMMEKAKNHYINLFKNEKILDLAAQWKSKIQSTNMGQNTGSFSFLFPVVMSEFSTQKSGKNEFKLSRFRFDRETEELKMDIDVKSISILDSAKTNLKNKGLQMEIVSANEEKEYISAVVTVKHL